MKQVYAIHEYGSPSHFNALDYLIHFNGGVLKYRELNLYKQLGSSIKNLSIIKFRKFFLNLFFLLTIFFHKPCKIVLGIAPYNYNLWFLRLLFIRHEVYYFTSYTCWDQSTMVHSRFYSERLLKIWKKFLQNEVRHIFAVSEFTKNELIKNDFSSQDRITVVNHSFKSDIALPLSTVKTLNFITVSTLKKSKGIDKLLEIFKKHPDLNLTIVGKGELFTDVQEAANNYSNIKYLGFINSFDDLVKIYCDHSFLLLNSQRTKIWEELFGMVIIEAMACGVIPITTDHPGPKEIISHGVDGFICEQSNIIEGINTAIAMTKEEYLTIRAGAITSGAKFSSSTMSAKWNLILD